MRNSSRGFTLIEIIIVIAIVAIIASIAALIILQGVRGYSAEEQRGNLHYQAKLAVERIAREARLIRSCADISSPINPSSSLSFIDIFGNLVTFNTAGTTLSRSGTLLANSIASAQFRFLDRAGNATTTCVPPNNMNNIWYVEIDIMAVQSPETLQIRTRVHPRNF
jgi:prepilin-type N-terminal cleavage/methylation domain-containing protein